ncbi:PAAR-like domain-containing protein [Pseudomonas chlororaphis]|uniref:Type VI secretion-associated protein, TagD family n=1 Tax=Pseudomonas chlororaphis O6 TaxID=1037915 RepID=A0AB33WZQ2_9PSED|nr:PAAR-like domain-containing protein [Pseudomonas chlororaphis]EIM18698.1 type VI secretion-associated protein, TagD family [Pseudomonas chlororaphis O6]
MTAANTNAAGISFTGCDPMVPVPGPNIAPNTTGIANVANYFCCGGNEQNLATIRTSTIDSGSAVGAASGTHSAQMQPMQGSSKYFIQGMPATRLGDMSVTNNNNMVVNQIAPSQTKYFINA